MEGLPGGGRPRGSEAVARFIHRCRAYGVYRVYISIRFDGLRCRVDYPVYTVYVNIYIYIYIYVCSGIRDHVVLGS